MIRLLVYTLNMVDWGLTQIGLGTGRVIELNPIAGAYVGDFYLSFFIKLFAFLILLFMAGYWYKVTLRDTNCHKKAMASTNRYWGIIGSIFGLICINNIIVLMGVL